MTLASAWDTPRVYPSIVYVETTNYCNAQCRCCLNHRCKRIRGTMSLDTFKLIADKVKERGLKIGAMFCFGEPLLDPTLTDKCAYARSLDVFTGGHIGFNTNVSMLTPEKYDGILQNTSNIILSFFATHETYEAITGNLKWRDSYDKACAFIEYRDMTMPSYPIFISVNKVQGHNLEAVKRAFADYNVRYVQDAELRWGGKVITGVLDRMIMYPQWRCDGYKGALQIKWNGDCEYCAYDIIGSPEGGETKFANVLVDDWGTIERNFKAAWVAGSTLCQRCDYWHHALDVMTAGYKRPSPLPADWYAWQDKYIDGDKYED